MQNMLVIQTVVKPAIQRATTIVSISKSKYNQLIRNGLAEGRVRCSSKKQTVYYSL